MNNYHFSKPSSIYITCPGISVIGQRDGGGAQLLRQLSTIAFTNKFGFRYVHTSLTSVAHNDHNDEQWTEKWENFFQLSTFSDVEIDNKVSFENFKKSIDIIPTLIEYDQGDTNRYYQIYNCHSYINRNISSYEGIRLKLRQSYDNTERIPTLLFDKNILNVAIHVRRGDVREKSHPERFTSAQKLKQVIRKIEEVIGSNDYKISIFCEEKQNDLEKLKSDQVQTIYHLDIFSVLDHLIHADLLVTSKSTVSYISALANMGIVIYEPFWHQPLHNWINMNKNFQVDLERKSKELYPNKFNG